MWIYCKTACKCLPATMDLALVLSVLVALFGVLLGAALLWVEV